MLGRSSSLRDNQLAAERIGDATCDLVLQGGQITDVALEPFGP
jgi:hypothetical protein